MSEALPIVMVSLLMPVEFLNPSQLPVGIGSVGADHLAVGPHDDPAGADRATAGDGHLVRVELGAAGGQEQGQARRGDRQRRTPGAGGEAGGPHDGHRTSWG